MKIKQSRQSFLHRVMSLNGYTINSYIKKSVNLLNQIDPMHAVSKARQSKSRNLGLRSLKDFFKNKHTLNNRCMHHQEQYKTSI